MSTTADITDVERRMEYRVTYPAQMGGTLDGEVVTLILPNQDELASMTSYLRARGLSWTVEYRQWTPDQWRVMGHD